MKKKLLGIFLIGVLVVSLTGCGKTNSESSNGSEKEQSKSIDLYPVLDKESGKYGYIDNSGKWAIEPSFRLASSFDPETGLANVKVTGKGCTTGFINTKGEFAIEAKYCGGQSFHNGYAHVIINDNVLDGDAIIDKNGNIVVEPYQYESMTDVSKNGIIGVKEKNSTNIKYIKLDGTVILDNNYNHSKATGFNEQGIACVFSNGTYMFIDEKGNQVGNNLSNCGTLNENGYGFIEKDDYAIVNNKGELLSDYIYYTTSKFNKNNLAMVMKNSSEPFQLINVEGKRVNDTNYTNAVLFLDGKWLVTLENGKQQVLNADGSILVKDF